VIYLHIQVIYLYIIYI